MKWLVPLGQEKGWSALEKLFLKTEVKKHVGEGTLRLGEGKGNRGANAGGSVSNQLRVKVMCLGERGGEKGASL